MTTVYRKYENEEDLYKKIDIANKSIETMTLERTNKKTGEIVRNVYAQVNQRVKAFRYVYTRGKIETKIISLDGETGKRICLMRCEVYDDLGNLISTGYAEEKEDSSFINQTSFIENCETSCVGRALGMAGFGIDTSIASAEEVETAIANQCKKEEAKPTSLKLSQFYLLYNQEEIAKILEHYKVSGADELPRKVVDEYIKNRKDKLQEAEAKDFEKMKAKPLVDDGNNPFY